MTIYIKKIEDEKVDKKYGSYSTQSKYNIIEIDNFLPKQYADQIEVLKLGRYSPRFSSSVPSAQSSIKGFINFYRLGIS